ncbi:MAG: hypothetical protein ACTSRP_12110 [Candidatus Helarchaeota archaeon]
MASSAKVIYQNIDKRRMFRAMRNEYIKEYILDAYKFYRSYNISEDIIYKAVNLLSRYLYVIHPEWPKNKYGFYSAALYIVLHSPTYEGLTNYQARNEFIKKLENVKLHTLNWYINKIQNALDIYRIHDNKLRPFWLDEYALETSIINGVIREKVKNIKNLEYYPYIMIVEEILKVIIEKLELIPRQFRKDFWRYISRKLENIVEHIDT